MEIICKVKAKAEKFEVVLDYCKRKSKCSKLYFSILVLRKHVMVLIVKPYFKAYGFDLLNHIL